MIPLKQALRSSIGKKLITAVTGLALVGFIITHLIGNLLLLEPSGEAFNRYSLKLADMGGLLYLAEAGLVAFFLVHAVNGLLLKKNNVQARGIEGYRRYQSKGGPTKQNLSSTTMAISGTILLIFLVLHIIHFKYGPGIEDGYATQLDGRSARDLQRWVVEAFQVEWKVAAYMLVMAFLGLHLRHGIWSMFQSLGLLNPRTNPVVYAIGSLVGVLLAVGFFFLPLYIYLRF